jgi:hypothetical protein
LRKYILGIPIVIAVAMTMGMAVRPPLPAGVYSPGAPHAPSGYTVTYAHNFTSQGRGDWVTQPYSNATDSVSTRFGFGIEVTGEDQWSEIISSDAVVGPNSFVQALVYIPAAGPKKLAANWPAFWTTGDPWPQHGEIDILEGSAGRSCLFTHYGTPTHHLNPPGQCAALGSAVGWVTISMLRTGGQVTAWYGSAKIGTIPLPLSANHELIFDNQDGPDDICQACNGPLVHPATAWLSRVTVWNKGRP